MPELLAPGRSVCVREGGWEWEDLPWVAHRRLDRWGAPYRKAEYRRPRRHPTACSGTLATKPRAIARQHVVHACSLAPVCRAAVACISRLTSSPSTPHPHTNRKKGGGMSKLPAGVSPTSRGKQGPCVALLDMRVCPPTTEATPKTRPRRVSGFPPTLAHPATPSPPGLLRANSTPPPAYRFRTQATLQGRCSGRLSGPSERGLPCQPQAKGGSVGEGWG